MTDSVILGINSAYHEPAACILRNGTVIAAAEEERFNRIRHGKVADLENPHLLPEKSIRFCMEMAGITAGDLTGIGYSFDPDRRLSHNIALAEETEECGSGTAPVETRFHELLMAVPNVLSNLLGEDLTDRFHWLEHHLCHAASAFYASPFSEAAILSVDGIGEATSTWLGVGHGGKITPVREIPYPNSLGFLWTKASRFLGFGEYGQWKVMGLSGYGDANRFYSAFRQFVNFGDGHLSIDARVLQFRVRDLSAFERLFGPARADDGDLEDHHRDFAAALQRITNEALLSLAGWLQRTTGMRALCQAGGVALNCIANRVILEEGPFDQTFVQPAANDAGTALGAAWYLAHHCYGETRTSGLQHVYLGPEATRDDMQMVGDRFGKTSAPDALEPEVARLIAAGEIVAWFQGRMEFGPRALGNRSFLADPRRPEVVHALNARVKHREYFRPFAASVLDEQAEEWFEFPRPSVSDAFMLIARRIRRERLGQIPAVTHIDNTCRIQRVSQRDNPEFHRLIAAFHSLTNIPLLLNTSLNDSEPIICTPEEAARTCVAGGLRWLVLGGTLVDLGSAHSADIGTTMARELLPTPSRFATHSQIAFRARRQEFAELADDGNESFQLPVKLPFRSR